MAGRGRGAPRPRDGGPNEAPRRPGTDQGQSMEVGGAQERAVVPSSGRGARRDEYVIVNTQTAPDGNKRAPCQPKVELYSNYFELESKPDFHLFQYHVDFFPDIEQTRARIALMHQHDHLFNKTVFDGSILHSTTRLERNPTEMVARRNDGTDITIRYRLVGEVNKYDLAYNQVMNNIVKSCLRKLNLLMIRRDYFDPAAAISTAHKLSIWPGYLTTIRRHDHGYLLNVEIKHKIVREDTALDVIKEIYRSGRRENFEEQVKGELVGKMVMTGYNNRTYRVDDVDFGKHPTDTFFLKKEDREISYIEYFDKRWQLKITDRLQPLLVVRPSRRDINRGDTSVSHLIPEICLMTGLSDAHLSNIRVKNDIGNITRVNPVKRVEALRRFRARLANTPAIVEELNRWGLNFKNDIVRCEGHVPTNEGVYIKLGANAQFQPGPRGWSTEMQRCQMAASPREQLKQWVVIFPGNATADVRSFCGILHRVSGGLNFQPAEPQYYPLQSDRTADYARAIREVCMRDDRMQMIVCVLRSKRADHYQAIKVQTLCEFGIPSQVICLRNATDEKKRMSVATKLMIQITAKLGGEPWRVKLPTTSWMIAGYDTYHDARQKRGVGAFVASVNKEFSRYYSKATLHENNEEIAPNFYEYTVNAIKAFHNENEGKFPSKVIIYRDGVGAGDVGRVLDMEVQQVQDAINHIRKIKNVEADIGLAFVVVNKRINTRFFVRDQNGFTNPKVGTVVDNTVTLPERFDFFLVSQNTNQGTVSPTSYNVIRNTANITPEIHQRLAYFLTHLYYNWAGTLSVPAPLQYAHKLAYLCGESLGKSIPKEGLKMLPYYL